MTLEETIQTMFDKSPEMFKERWQCLDHLFCVAGNGYEWVDGELLDVNEYDYDVFPIDKKCGNQFWGVLGKDGKAVQRKKVSKDFSAKGFYGEVDEDYPENIKEDWLKGIEETRLLYEVIGEE